MDELARPECRALRHVQLAVERIEHLVARGEDRVRAGADVRLESPT